MLKSLPTPQILPVKDAWKPLPLTHWNTETAAHLLRRIGYSATPTNVQQALNGPISKTLAKAFGAVKPNAKSPELRKFETEFFDRSTEANRIKDREERRIAQRNIRRESDHLFRQYAVEWYRFAREEAN
ncbi:MAG: hypothetical protein ACPGH0_06650, partial [Opitutales bacterium]